MVIQDQQLTDLSKNRQQLIRDIDKEEDAIKRAVLVGKLVIIERDIESIRSKSLSTTAVSEPPTLEKSSAEDINNPGPNKLKTTLIKGDIKHSVAAELIAILNEKGYDDDQKRKILSSAYQILYKHKEMK